MEAPSQQHPKIFPQPLAALLARSIGTRLLLYLRRHCANTEKADRYCNSAAARRLSCRQPSTWHAGMHAVMPTTDWCNAYRSRSGYA